MQYSYKIIVDPAEHATIYRRLREEDLLWCLFSEIEQNEWSEELYIKMHNSSTLRETWAGYIDGQLAGIAYLWPFQLSWRTRCAEIGLTAFRPFFRHAARLCREGLLRILEHHKVDGEHTITSFVGRVPAPNRHILNMLGKLGFTKQCKIPDLFWFTKQQKHVDGWLVMAKPMDVKATWEV